LKVNETVKPGFTVENETIRMSASIGISIYPKDGSDSKSLLKKADDALYLAKEKGRDTFHFFSPQSEYGE